MATHDPGTARRFALHRLKVARGRVSDALKQDNAVVAIKALVDAEHAKDELARLGPESVEEAVEREDPRRISFDEPQDDEGETWHL